MKFDEFDWFMILGIPILIIVAAGVITYDAELKQLGVK